MIRIRTYCRGDMVRYKSTINCKNQKHLLVETAVIISNLCRKVSKMTPNLEPDALLEMARAVMESNDKEEKNDTNENE